MRETENGNQEKRSERERKKERSESKLIKMTAELWGGGEEGQISFSSRRQICTTRLNLDKTQRMQDMRPDGCVSIQPTHQNGSSCKTLLYKHKTVAYVAGGDVSDC